MSKTLQPKIQYDNSENSLHSSKIALEFMHYEAIEQGKFELAKVLKEAITECNKMLSDPFLECYEQSVEELKFYFIRAVLILPPEELDPLISFLDWLTERKKVH